MSSSVNGCPGTVFLVTIDVEADNEWARGRQPTYDSIQLLRAFQRLCDRYGVRPTYLVTYDVASDSKSSSVLLELLEEGNCEIGAHMHGWWTAQWLRYGLGPITEEPPTVRGDLVSCRRQAGPIAPRQTMLRGRASKRWK